jgi:hypothetical protein
MRDIRGACQQQIMLIFSDKKGMFHLEKLILINPQKMRKVLMELSSL